jgi:hypothetical protein
MDFAQELSAVVREVEQHVAAGGWDQPVRLFALVPTIDVLAADPSLSLSGDLSLTSVEQELDQVVTSVEDLLATIAWPEEIVGAIVVLERIILPPEAEVDLPNDSDEAFVRIAAEHPMRRDVRMVSAVLRSGQNMNALRFKIHDNDDDVAVAADLIPSLNEGVLATFS